MQCPKNFWTPCFSVLVDKKLLQALSLEQGSVCDTVKAALLFASGLVQEAYRQPQETNLEFAEEIELFYCWCLAQKVETKEQPKLLVQEFKNSCPEAISSGFHKQSENCQYLQC